MSTLPSVTFVSSSRSDGSPGGGGGGGAFLPPSMARCGKQRVAAFSFSRSS